MADMKGESLDTAASTAGLFLYGWNATDDLKVPATLLGASAVATRTALKAVDTTIQTVATLTEAGREGTFVWTAGNYSTQIAADTQEGIYVKANAVASSAGAWVRVYASDFKAEWFGVVATTVTNNATALQAAIDLSTSHKKTLLLPGGVVYSGNLTLRANTAIRGTGVLQSIIRAISGTTGTFVATASADEADIVLEGFSLDGNYPTVTSGDTLHLYGSRPTVRDFAIVNSAGTGLITSYTLSDRLYSILGHFSHITIDKCQHTGWRNEGPNDSFISHVEIVDASLGADSTYFGYICTGAGTARIFDLHVWNRSPTGNKPLAGAYLNNGGNIIQGSHFESGNISMIVNVGYNIMEGCAWYAPDGSIAILLIGSDCVVKGMVGGGADAFHPDFAGLVLGDGGGGTSGGNIIELLDAGCNNGAIDFTGTAGQNVVRVRGDKAAGKTTYSGSPASTDTVDIRTSGAGAATLIQTPEQGASIGVGYRTGAGGTVTQASSKATGVTLSKSSGQITMNGAALAAATIVSFTLTNTQIAAGDVLILNHVSGGTPGAYTINAQCGAGSATINVRNNTAGSLSEAIVIGFVLVKGVTA